MIWLTWRQFRAQATAALLAVTAVALLLTLTRGHLTGLSHTVGIDHCVSGGGCATARRAFFDQLGADQLYPGLFYAGAVLLYLLPAVLGLFWGAPLIAREVEAGTFRLAWSQSVTRLRWLGVKLGLIGLAAVATAGLLSLAISWWSGPIDHAASVPTGGQEGGVPLPVRFSPLVFGARGLVPLGVALFAFVLGVTCGLLLRRLLPAMAVTLLVVTAVQVGLPMTARAQYLAPVRTTEALTLVPGRPGTDLLFDGNHVKINEPVDIPGAWVTSISTVDAHGHAWSGPGPQICLDPKVTAQQCFDAVNALRLSQVVEYQPADRYWTFQGIETGLYLAGAAALAALCAVRIRSLRLDRVG